MAKRDSTAVTGRIGNYAAPIDTAGMSEEEKDLFIKSGGVRGRLVRDTIPEKPKKPPKPAKDPEDKLDIRDIFKPSKAEREREEQMHRHRGSATHYDAVTRLNLKRSGMTIQDMEKAARQPLPSDSTRRRK